MNITTKELKEIVPLRFHNLPMMNTIPNMDFDSNFMCVSNTGSGKSILLPLVEATLYPERKIYVRQPSRLSTHHLYHAYQKFYGDVIDVGVSTSNLKENDEAQILFVSDGILSYVFKRGFKGASVYLDELHQLIPATEIELAMLKKEVKRRKDVGNKEPLVRLLTATIEPKQFSDYMMLDNNIFKSVGKMFTIKEEIVQINEKCPVECIIKSFLVELAKKKHNALIFVATRAETESYCEDYKNIIETSFIHAGESPDKVEDIFYQRKEPIAIFSTIAGATSITIDVDEVLIIDEMIYSDMEQGLMKIKRVPCDDNLLLQMRGRCGRTKEGRVILATSRNINWTDIKPRPVSLPLEKQTPYQISLLMAEYGIKDITQLQLLSKLNVEELRYANDYLKDRNLIEYLDDKVQLTKAGKRVKNLPIDIHLAIILAKSSPELRPLVTAAFCSGYDNIWNFMGSKMVNGKRVNNKLLIEFHDKDSEFLVKGKIIIEAIKHSKQLSKWCFSKGFNPRKLSMYLSNFRMIERYIGKQSEKLLSYDIEKYRSLFVRQILINNVFDRVEFTWNNDKEYFSGFHKGYWTLLSEDTSMLLNVKYNLSKVVISGKVVEIISKNKNKIRILSCGTIIK